MKVFISQPMMSLSNEQIKANKKEVVDKLTDLGYEVLDSVFDYEDIPNIKHKSLFYLAKSLELMAKEADVVYFMDGWSQTRGCILEHACCEHYQITTMYDFEEVR